MAQGHETTEWHLRPPVSGNPIVFFGRSSDREMWRPGRKPREIARDLLSCADVAIGDIPAGRIKMELWADICPKTAENFRQFCTGASRREDPPLSSRAQPCPGCRRVPEERPAGGLQEQHLPPRHQGLYDPGGGLSEGECAPLCIPCPCSPAYLDLLDRSTTAPVP